MAQNISNNFSEVFPKHPHRRVRILIAVLCFVVVVSMVTLYQINKMPKVPPIPPEALAANNQLVSPDIGNIKPLSPEEANSLLKVNSGIKIK
jgi:hypothetical protein